MGSSQSNQQADDTGSFSIDPSGNIKRRSSPVSDNKDHSIGQSNKATTNTSGLSASPLIDESQLTSNVELEQKQLRTSSERATKSSDTDGMNLREADEILTRMKTKYRSSEMAGKNRSIFEEVERNLTHCYGINKSQPTRCSDVFNGYRDYVNEQRGELLRKSKSQYCHVPLLTSTSVLVLIACLLLHVTTVSCFGAMSIDLGSECMKVGLVAPSVPMDIVLNTGSQRKTAMAIAFANGERFIGDTALDVASKYPEKTFTHFLDLVGKTIQDESVNHYKRRFPFSNITSHEPNSTSILLNHPEGFSFTPLELIAMMLQHAYEQVMSRLNHYESANDVVITVPPFFNKVERRVIRDAARVAGLNVLRLTNVNSAFALSYGIFRHKEYQPESADAASNNRTTILFFDQGASHTSATLADYHLVEQFDEQTGLSRNESLPTVTIRAQAYDRFLGGFDMQLKLRDHLVKTFSEKTNIAEERILKRGRSASKLLKESGRVKKVLSANMDHVVRVENVIDDRDLKQTITRQEFEEMNQEFLGARITQLLDRLFEMPNVNRDDPLNSVIIVGGNTRTPKVQQVLMDYFKLDALGKSINADEGAALAALYQAASLGRGFRVKKFILEEFGEERKRFDPSAATSTTITPIATDGQSTDVASESSGSSGNEVKELDSIYSESELERVRKKLDHMREQDYMRLQRMSLKNSLESLLSESRMKLSNGEETLEEQVKNRKDEIQKLVSETSSWLEEGPQGETDNVTMLADKYNIIHQLIHPRPPPPPPASPPKFDPSTIDLSSVFNNETLSILDKLNFTNPFSGGGDQAELADNESFIAVSEQSTATMTSTPLPASQGESPITDDTIKPAETDKPGPPHSEL